MSDAGTTDFDLIASLLPSLSSTSGGDEEDDPETDDILRETTLLLLRLLYVQAHGQLESMDQEFELLHSAPPPPRFVAPPTEDGRSRTKEVEDMWKLDAPTRQGRNGPLLDSNGKVRSQLVCSIQDAFHRAFVGSLFNHLQFCQPELPTGHDFNPKCLVQDIVYLPCL